MDKQLWKLNPIDHTAEVSHGLKIFLSRNCGYFDVGMRLSARSSACVSSLDNEMKIQILTSKQLANRLYALRMKLTLRLRMKLAEMQVLFRKGLNT